jgi:hypothetical protein
MKNKILKILTNHGIFFLAIYISNIAHAEWSYGGKFISATLSGCAAGGVSAYSYADSTGYDSQPKQVVTLLGMTTGCVTGAIFSYFFFDDPSRDLAQNNEHLRSANAQLQLQIQQITNAQNLGMQNYSMTQSANQNSHSPTNPSLNDDYSILKNLDIGKIDPTKIGGTGGISGGIKQCNIIYPIWMDDAGFVHSFSGKSIAATEKWIPVSPNFAIKTWQFYFSPDGCFEQNKQYGFFEHVIPGLTNRLWQELRTVERKKTKEKNIEE